MAITYNTIEEALQDLRNGKCILVTDDPDRENEGDLICAGQFATTENVNLMASAAKGLICMPMSHDNIVRLGLTQMVSHNTDNHEMFSGAANNAEKTERCTYFHRIGSI